eukprot:RCo029821
MPSFPLRSPYQLKLRFNAEHPVILLRAADADDDVFIALLLRTNVASERGCELFQCPLMVFLVTLSFCIMFFYVFSCGNAFCSGPNICRHYPFPSGEGVTPSD